VRCIYTWRGGGRKVAEPMGGRVTGRGGRSHNRLWKGEVYISVSAGGITVVHSVAVCFSWVYVAVVSRICWGWLPTQSFFIHLPMKMESIEGSETSAIRTKTPGNYPKENILHIEHGESLKSKIHLFIFDSKMSHQLLKFYLTYYRHIEIKLSNWFSSPFSACFIPYEMWLSL
jgi:hypothetical protein